MNTINNNKGIAFQAQLKITKKTPFANKKSDIPLIKLYKHDAAKIGNKKDIVVVNIEDPLYSESNNCMGITTKFIRKGKCIENDCYENSFRTNEEKQEYKQNIVEHFLTELQKKYNK